jgi:hypothetical protein
LCSLTRAHERAAEYDLRQQAAANHEFSRSLSLLDPLGRQSALVVAIYTELSIGVAEKIGDHEFGERSY